MLGPDPAAREEWRATAIATSVSPLRIAAGAFAREMGFAEADVDDIAIAVSEAATNSVVHAFPDGSPPGTITVIGRMTAPGTLEIVVADDGCGMSPRPDSPGLGLGFPLMAELADRLTIEPVDGGGTRVTMDFTLLVPENERLA
jgi:serine/threonine-protein kinase RsbW/stage II sporulation protein AB (anti-sigma F factor)